ncbi:hypothetical protein, partial [Streptomyces sp. IBSBF 2390]|uniref:hypothetical protein n=1 Tax=Streptomyces sp. IBSBF 2390 TaxID=2903533 RepID=UPI002FDC1C20
HKTFMLLVDVFYRISPLIKILGFSNRVGSHGTRFLVLRTPNALKYARKGFSELKIGFRVKARVLTTPRFLLVLFCHTDIHFFCKFFFYRALFG